MAVMTQVLIARMASKILSDEKFISANLLVWSLCVSVMPQTITDSMVVYNLGGRSERSERSGQSCQSGQSGSVRFAGGICFESRAVRPPCARTRIPPFLTRDSAMEGSALDFG